MLDIQRIRYLLEHTLDRVRNNELTLIELIPALVNLLAIEKSPFANQVMNFVEVYFRKLGRAERLQLMTTIAGSGTREAARLLLYLHPTLPDEGLHILKELVLIGSAAVEEALQWHRRGDLSNAKLEELLLRSYVPEATQALWERYGLEPEVKSAVTSLAWAESWACRLTLPENERMMRAIPYNGPIDPNIWPYRKSQRTALAAIGQKCVQILSRVYKGKTYANNEQQKEEFVLSV